MGANVIFVVWSNALCYRTNKIGCDHIRALDRYQANRQRYERNERNKPHTTDYMHESEEKIIIWFNRIAVIFNVYWIRMQRSLRKLLSYRTAIWRTCATRDVFGYFYLVHVTESNLPLPGRHKLESTPTNIHFGWYGERWVVMTMVNVVLISSFMLRINTYNVCWLTLHDALFRHRWHCGQNALPHWQWAWQIFALLSSIQKTTSLHSA